MLSFFHTPFIACLSFPIFSLSLPACVPWQAFSNDSQLITKRRAFLQGFYNSMLKEQPYCSDVEALYGKIALVGNNKKSW